MNYFRDHVYANHSELVRPLQVYLSQNNANRVKLSEQAKLAFFQLKEISSLQTKLFYYTEGDQIYFLTDASDYGIGGYLYQLIDNVEKPVAFISKSLTRSRLHWPTIQKEAYSIFYSIRQLDFFIFSPIIKTKHLWATASKQWSFAGKLL